MDNINIKKYIVSIYIPKFYFFIHINLIKKFNTYEKLKKIIINAD